MSGERTLTVKLLRMLKRKQLPDSLEELRVMESHLDGGAFKERVVSRIKELEEEQEKNEIKEELQRAYKKRDYEYLHKHAKHLSREQKKMLTEECKQPIVDREKEIEDLDFLGPIHSSLKCAGFDLVDTRYRDDAIVTRNLKYIHEFVADRKELASVYVDLLQEAESYTVVWHIVKQPLDRGQLTSEIVPHILKIAKRYQEPRFLEFLLEYDAPFLEQRTSTIMERYLEIFDQFAEQDGTRYDYWYTTMVEFLIEFSKKHPEQTETYAQDILERVTNELLASLYNELISLDASAKDLVVKLEHSEVGESLLYFLVATYYYIAKGEELEKSFFARLEEMVTALEQEHNLHAHSLYGALNLYRKTQSYKINYLKAEEIENVEKCQKVMEHWHAQVSKSRNPEEFLPLLDALDFLTNGYRAIGNQFPPNFLEEKSDELITTIEDDLSTYTQRQLLELFSDWYCVKQAKEGRLQVLRSRLIQECKTDPNFCLELFELSSGNHEIMNKEEILNAMSDENPIEAGV